jgi:hypothetical protein
MSNPETILDLDDYFVIEREPAKRYEVFHATGGFVAETVYKGDATLIATLLQEKRDEVDGKTETKLALKAKLTRIRKIVTGE